MQRQLVAERVLDGDGVEPGFDLDEVQHVQPKFDQLGDERGDIAAGVETGRNTLVMRPFLPEALAKPPSSVRQTQYSEDSMQNLFEIHA